MFKCVTLFLEVIWLKLSPQHVSASLTSVNVIPIPSVTKLTKMRFLIQASPKTKEKARMASLRVKSMDN